MPLDKEELDEFLGPARRGAETARRISQNTFFVRKVFPFLWFGILITVFCGMVVAMLNSGQESAARIFRSLRSPR